MFRQVAVKSSSAPFSARDMHVGGVAPQRYAMSSIETLSKVPYFTVLLLWVFLDRASPDLFFETKIFSFWGRGFVWLGENFGISFFVCYPSPVFSCGAVG